MLPNAFWVLFLLGQHKEKLQHKPSSPAYFMFLFRSTPGSGQKNAECIWDIDLDMMDGAKNVGILNVSGQIA